MKKHEIKTPLSPRSMALPIPEISKPENSSISAQEVPYVGSPIAAPEIDIISSLTNSAHTTLTNSTLSSASSSRPTSPEIELHMEEPDIGVFSMELD